LLFAISQTWPKWQESNKIQPRLSFQVTGHFIWSQNFQVFKDATVCRIVSTDVKEALLASVFQDQVAGPGPRSEKQHFSDCTRDTIHNHPHDKLLLWCYELGSCSNLGTVSSGLIHLCFFSPKNWLDLVPINERQLEASVICLKFYNHTAGLSTTLSKVETAVNNR